MQRTNRRLFLQRTTLAGALAGLQAPAFAAASISRSPNEKLHVAFVGITGRGGANINELLGIHPPKPAKAGKDKAKGGAAGPAAPPPPDEKDLAARVVALCDVDDRHLDRVGQQFPKARRYNDWRKLLEQKDIEAVVVCTTEHTHAPICVSAMRLGKHVYCEKPLGHSVQEARLMAETARQYNVATQMGTQIHATENYRRVVELVQAGAIGVVSEAHVWCDRTPLGNRARPQEEEAVPPHLHWDLWLGPAPFRPYNHEYLPGCLTWDKRWDFGNGTLGDMGSHLIDLPFWALDLRHPTTVEAEGDPRDDETYPRWLKARWQHPARGPRPAVTVFWYDGKQRPPTPPGIDLTGWSIGVIFIGSQGTLVADYGRRVLLPEDRYKGFQPPPPSIPPSPGQQKEWLAACTTGSPTLCNFDYSGALVEHNLLGCAAFRLGKKLEWDAVNLKATNCPEADRFIRKQYRKGWEWI